MKCPKCGYVSFDYNLSCPKCNKDISEQQARMNIASFRASPPALLGALIGETDEESNAELNISGTHETMAGYQPFPDLDEPAELLDQTGLDDSQDISIELETDAEDRAFDRSGSDVSSERGFFDLELQNGEEELSPEPDVLLAEQEADISAGSASLDTSAEPEEEDIGLSLDFEDQPLTSDREEKSEQDEMELNPDDLKVDETGELEIAGMAEPQSSKDEEELSLSLDETEAGLQSIPLPDSGEEISFETEDDEIHLDLDLENMDLELDLDLDLEDSERNQ